MAKITRKDRIAFVRAYLADAQRHKKGGDLDSCVSYLIEAMEETLALLERWDSE